ncbi:hypothetical protein CesoFtcFv8_006957 [Champsocephalus esox]|uniref:Uncharacterized protein n=1 Tax=Champsocephalus esox TaxID=159716 RepID=A0AAN8H3Q9_9TELE|nr:hypothetical protein CesoFtcFv8_006957 [Champsocephalus esox]
MVRLRFRGFQTHSELFQCFEASSLPSRSQIVKERRITTLIPPWGDEKPLFDFNTMSHKMAAPPVRGGSSSLHDVASLTLRPAGFLSSQQNRGSPTR